MPRVPFVPGLDLSRQLYDTAVRPLLAEHFPGLPHSAALIGHGSDVLGFDTERSADHDWGPRLHLFLAEEQHGDKIHDLLAERLPPTIAGYPTHFAPTGEARIRRMQATTGRIEHGVVVTGLTAWLTGHLGFDPQAGITTLDWLATPTQTLAEVTGGAVHHDGLGRLGPVRSALARYPDDLWRYLLACQWQRLDQEEPFVGRCGEAGDDLGSAVVAARLARDLMRLCLLMDRRYPPYSKWLGSAFASVPDAGRLGPVLSAALAAGDWHAREHHLVTAYEIVAARHNDLGLTAPLDPHVRPFHDRPFRVLGAGRFARALAGTLADPVLRDLPLTGAVDQFVDSTDALVDRASSRASTAARYPGVA